jgi:nitrite reductase/ring-hydroxylating ferredoxin subunit
MTEICNLDDIEPGASIGVTVEIDGNSKMLIVVRQAEYVYAYINSCPHIGTPLDLQPGKFLSHDKKNIMCSTHGALFEINTGHCTFGPCKDDHLEVLPVRLEKGAVLFAG